MNNKTRFQKRVNGCSSVGYSSQNTSVLSSTSCMMKPKVTDSGIKSIKVHGGPDSSDNQVYRTRFIHKGQSWGFTSRSTARVILGQVLRIATCGTRTHRGDSL